MAEYVRAGLEHHGVSEKIKDYLRHAQQKIADADLELSIPATAKHAHTMIVYHQPWRSYPVFGKAIEDR